MLQAAKVHHLCYSVDYKRGVLQILLNSKEALIILCIHSIFQCCMSCYIHAQISFIEKQLADTVCAQNPQIICHVFEFRLLCQLRIVFPKCKGILQGHLWN